VGHAAVLVLVAASPADVLRVLAAPAEHQARAYRFAGLRPPWHVRSRLEIEWTRAVFGVHIARPTHSTRCAVGECRARGCEYWCRPLRRRVAGPEGRVLLGRECCGHGRQGVDIVAQLSSSELAVKSQSQRARGVVGGRRRRPRRHRQRHVRGHVWLNSCRDQSCLVSRGVDACLPHAANRRDPCFSLARAIRHVPASSV
jgi:hypothetical protein